MKTRAIVQILTRWKSTPRSYRLRPSGIRRSPCLAQLPESRRARSSAVAGSRTSQKGQNSDAPRAAPHLQGRPLVWRSKPGGMHGAGLPLFVAGVLWWLGVFPWSLPGFAATVDVLCIGDFDGVSAAAGIASVNATVKKANFLSIVRILPSRFPGIPVNRAQCLNIRPASTCSTPKTSNDSLTRYVTMTA